MGRRRRAGAATDTTGAATDTAAGKVVAAAREVTGRKPLTAAQARRMIGISKAVAPLLAPYALAAASVARSRWDAHRAARLGVRPDQLSAYAGPGGALHARLSRVAEALTELDTGATVAPSAESREFVAATRPRLADLAVAVRAAEQMPSSRRRAAYRAISGELDRVEIDLLTHLGVLT